MRAGNELLFWSCEFCVSDISFLVSILMSRVRVCCVYIGALWYVYYLPYTTILARVDFWSKCTKIITGIFLLLLLPLSWVVPFQNNYYFHVSNSKSTRIKIRENNNIVSISRWKGSTIILIMRFFVGNGNQLQFSLSPTVRHGRKMYWLCELCQRNRII